MSEWWTYGLSDFLMFSPQAYWRLVARYNEAWWPVQAGGVAAVAALWAVAWRGGPARPAMVLLAFAWAFTGWAFLWRRYAEIFLGAPWAAAACAVEAASLVVAALLPSRLPAAAVSRVRVAGAVLVAFALLFPLLSPAQGRGWGEAEVFGFMPDPTALATLGILLAVAVPAWQRIVLAVVPALVLALGAATRWLIA